MSSCTLGKMRRYDKLISRTRGVRGNFNRSEESSLVGMHTQYGHSPRKHVRVRRGAIITLYQCKLHCSNVWGVYRLVRYKRGT